MATERNRLIELAIESLESKRKQIDAEITALRGELRAPRGRRKRGDGSNEVAGSAQVRTRRRSRFSKEERMRRSKRMKAYWEKWRKERASPR